MQDIHHHSERMMIRHHHHHHHHRSSDHHQVSRSSSSSFSSDPYWDNAFYPHLDIDDTNIEEDEMIPNNGDGSSSMIPTTNGGYVPTSYASLSKKKSSSSLLTIQVDTIIDESINDKPIAELFYEGNRNFWKLKRGVTITIWKHVSFNNCLEMIVFDSDDKKMTSINPPIYIDYYKLYRKACGGCGSGKVDKEDDYLINRRKRDANSYHNLLLHHQQQQQRTSYLQEGPQEKAAMINYLFERIKMTVTNLQVIQPRKELHHSEKSHTIKSDFLVSLSPLPGDDIIMLPGSIVGEQVDVVCSPPMEVKINVLSQTPQQPEQQLPSRSQWKKKHSHSTLRTNSKDDEPMMDKAVAKLPTLILSSKDQKQTHMVDVKDIAKPSRKQEIDNNHHHHRHRHLHHEQEQTTIQSTTSMVTSNPQADNHDTSTASANLGVVVETIRRDSFYGSKDANDAHDAEEDDEDDVLLKQWELKRKADHPHDTILKHIGSQTSLVLFDDETGSESEYGIYDDNSENDNASSDEEKEEEDVDETEPMRKQPLPLSLSTESFSRQPTPQLYSKPLPSLSSSMSPTNIDHRLSKSTDSVGSSSAAAAPAMVPPTMQKEKLSLVKRRLPRRGNAMIHPLEPLDTTATQPPSKPSTNLPPLVPTLPVPLPLPSSVQLSSRPPPKKRIEKSNMDGKVADLYVESMESN